MKNDDAIVVAFWARQTQTRRSKNKRRVRLRELKLNRSRRKRLIVHCFVLIDFGSSVRPSVCLLRDKKAENVNSLAFRRKRDAEKFNNLRSLAGRRRVSSQFN